MNEIEMDNYEKGAQVERDLVNTLDNWGWYAARVAGSGSRDGDTGDVVAYDGESMYVFECKHVEGEMGEYRVEKDSIELHNIRKVIRENSDLRPERSDCMNETMFAFQFDGSSTIYLAPFTANSLSKDRKDEYMRLWELE